MPVKGLTSLLFGLLKVFEVQSIQLSMGESMRPQQMAIYKSGADGGFDQLVPWLYVVTDLSECNSQFAVPEKLVPDSADAVLCQPYSTAATEIDELVKCRFLSRVSTLTRDIDIAILSVCPSVRP